MATQFHAGRLRARESRSRGVTRRGNRPCGALPPPWLGASSLHHKIITSVSAGECAGTLELRGRVSWSPGYLCNHCEITQQLERRVVCGAHPALARQIGPILACRLPASRPRLDDDIAHQGREPEYRIKSANEPHERVATESELSKAQAGCVRSFDNGLHAWAEPCLTRGKR